LAVKQKPVKTCIICTFKPENNKNIGRKALDSNFKSCCKFMATIFCL